MRRTILGQIFGTQLQDDDTTRLWPHGLVVALYISYGLGTSIIGDTGRPCWVVVSSYVGTALLAWASLGWWVTDRKKAFRKSQEYGESESWRKEILTSARSSFWGVFLVGAATVGVQLSL